MLTPEALAALLPGDGAPAISLDADVATLRYAPEAYEARVSADVEALRNARGLSVVASWMPALDRFAKHVEVCVRLVEVPVEPAPVAKAARR